MMAGELRAGRWRSWPPTGWSASSSARRKALNGAGMPVPALADGTGTLFEQPTIKPST